VLFGINRLSPTPLPEKGALPAPLIRERGIRGSEAI